MTDSSAPLGRYAFAWIAASAALGWLAAGSLLPTTRADASPSAQPVSVQTTALRSTPDCPAPTSGRSATLEAEIGHLRHALAELESAESQARSAGLLWPDGVEPAAFSRELASDLEDLFGYEGLLDLDCDYYPCLAVVQGSGDDGYDGLDTLFERYPHARANVGRFLVQGQHITWHTLTIPAKDLPFDAEVAISNRQADLESFAMDELEARLLEQVERGD